MKKITSKLLLILIIFALGSCKKYEDGPILSFRTKKARLTGSWKITKTIGNGVEFKGVITDLNIKDDGSFYFDFSGPFVGVKKGAWQFTSDKQNVDFSNECCTDRYRILKLENRELWLKNSFQISPINTLVYEYHFKQ